MAFLQDIKERGLSQNYLVNSYILLKLFFDWCYKEKVIKKDLLKDIPRPKNKAKTIIKSLTEEEIQKVYKATDDIKYPTDSIRYRNKTIVELLFHALRANELLSIKISDMDVDGKTLLNCRGERS